MNIIKKQWIDTKDDHHKYVEQELNEYNFNGRIDFSSNPAFPYDIQLKIVLDNDSNNVIINGIVSEVKNSGNFVVVERVQLSKNYNLQDFFNDNKDAKCIVFYLSGQSLFHEGYTIRTYIDKE